MESTNVSKIAEKIASCQMDEIMQILQSAPPVLSERTQKWSMILNTSFIYHNRIIFLDISCVKSFDDINRYVDLFQELFLRCAKQCNLVEQ